MLASLPSQSLLACSHCRQGQEKTVLSLPRRRCEHNCRQDKIVLSCLDLVSNFQVSLILNISETEQLQIRNWVETRQNCLVLSPIVFTPPMRTRQDKTVLSRPCQRCDQAITIPVLFQLRLEPTRCFLCCPRNM